jgi:hypothetical protein
MRLARHQLARRVLQRQVAVADKGYRADLGSADADDVQRVDAQHARNAHARQQARVVRLRHVLQVVQRPTGEAPAPVRVAGAQRMRSKRKPQVDAVLGVGAAQAGAEPAAGQAMKTVVLREGEKLGELELFFDEREIERALAARRTSTLQLVPVQLARLTRLSQHTISDITGVSRDTIRKYVGDREETVKRGVARKAEA